MDRRVSDLRIVNSKCIGLSTTMGGDGKQVGECALEEAQPPDGVGMRSRDHLESRKILASAIHALKQFPANEFHKWLSPATQRFHVMRVSVSRED